MISSKKKIVGHCVGQLGEVHRIKGKSRDRVIQETQPSAPAAGTGTAAPVRPYIGNCLYKWLDVANIGKSLSKK